MDYELIKNTEARHVLGVGNTTFYEQQKGGLITSGVKLGAHSVAWPKHEIQAIAAYRIAGRSDDEIRALVKQLIEHRKKLPANVQAMLSHRQSVGVASLPREAAHNLSRGPDELASIEIGGNANEQ